MIQYSKSLNPGLGQAQRRGKKKMPFGPGKTNGANDTRVCCRFAP